MQVANNKALSEPRERHCAVQTPFNGEHKASGKHHSSSYPYNLTLIILLKFHSPGVKLLHSPVKPLPGIFSM